LDRLGVVEDELEFEVVDEPRKGLFGISRGDARIRARVKPISREKPTDRKRRRRPNERSSRSGQGGGGRGGGQRSGRSGGASAPRASDSAPKNGGSTTADGDAGAATKAKADRPAGQGEGRRRRRGGRGRGGGGGNRPAGGEIATNGSDDDKVNAEVDVETV